MEVQNTGDNSMQADDINEVRAAVSKFVTPRSLDIMANDTDSNYKGQNSTILKFSELNGQEVTEGDTNSEVIHSILEVQTSQNKSEEFEAQLNAINSDLKKFDTNNNYTSATDTISITMDLNEDIFGNNFDSLQGKSHTDQQGTRTWKKLARDPNRSESHMQTVSLGKRNREREETVPTQPTKKIQVTTKYGKEESMVEAVMQPRHHK